MGCPRHVVLMLMQASQVWPIFPLAYLAIDVELIVFGSYDGDPIVFVDGDDMTLNINSINLEAVEFDVPSVDLQINFDTPIPTLPEYINGTIAEFFKDEIKDKVSEIVMSSVNNDVKNYLPMSISPITP